MRKWMILGGLVAMMVFAAGCGKKISVEQAKALALEDAGLTASEVTFTRELQDEGEIELRFQTGEEKYEYEISRTGKIEAKSREFFRDEEMEK